MSITAKSKYPAELAAGFAEYADILEMYANDSQAVLDRGYYKQKRERERVAERIRVWREIAEEMRGIKWEPEA